MKNILYLICMAVFAVSCVKDNMSVDNVVDINQTIGDDNEIASLTDALTQVAHNREICAEVHTSVNKFIELGLDEYLPLNYIWDDDFIQTKAGNSGCPLLKDYLTINWLEGACRTRSEASGTEIVIYWPYSDNWDGSALPTITPSPEDPEQDWNYGYKLYYDRRGELQVDTVVVDDDYAYDNPVWIINYSEISYEDMKRIIESKMSTKSADTGHMWSVVEATVSKQYDNIFQGGAEMEFHVGYPELEGYAKGEAILPVFFTRKEIRNETPKVIEDGILNTDWTEAELTNLLIIVEHDNGDPKTITTTTGVTDQETGITNSVGLSVTITDKDELIYQQNLKRSFVFSSIGTGTFDNNGFEWVTEINQYTL